jgi:hypothetical protein
MKKLLSIFFFLTFLAGNSFASQLYFNAGYSLMAVPGQPNFENESIIGNIAYETKSLWRFGVGIAEFSHKNSGNDGNISSQIMFAEKIWVYQFRAGVSFIGGFGPALFSTKVGGLGDDYTKQVVGVSATGSIRIAMSKLFIDIAAQYRNAAIAGDTVSVDAGYRGLLIGAGIFF